MAEDTEGARRKSHSNITHWRTEEVLEYHIKLNGVTHTNYKNQPV